MKTLDQPRVFPSLDKIEIIKSKQDALNNVMEVTLGYGYLDENDNFVLVKIGGDQLRHVFAGQDYADIITSPDPEAIIYQKLGINAS